VAGASAYPRTLDFEAFSSIAKMIDARLMVDMAHIAGLVAAGEHPSPLPHADVVTSTTHKTLRGPRGGLILSNEKLGKSLNSQIFPGIQGGPLMHVIAAKAVAFAEAMKPEFIDYQKQVRENARLLAELLMEGGINLVSGGTDNHMMLVDLRNKDITGKEAEKALEVAGLTVNKNAIPFDPRKPSITSGFRLGTPSITTRGMKEPEIKLLASYIIAVLEKPMDENKLKKIRNSVGELCQAFPIYK